MKNNMEFHDYPEDPEDIKLKIREMLKESATSDIKRYVSLLGMVGVHQRSLMLLDEAEKTLYRVLEVIAENDLSIALYAQNKIRIAHVYQWQKKFDISNAIFEEIINLCETNVEASQYLHFAYQHHGKNLFDQERYQEAHEYFICALKIRIEKNIPSDQLQSTQTAIEIVRKYLA